MSKVNLKTAKRPKVEYDKMEDKQNNHTSSLGAKFFCERTAQGVSVTGKEGTYRYVDALQRYVVVQFLYNRIEEGRNTLSMAYTIRNETLCTSTVQLVLRDGWARTPIMRDGTIINIVDSLPDENGTFVVERHKGYIVVEPDQLVAVTNITAQSWCERKAALSEKFRLPVHNTDTLRGTIAHELIGQSVKKRLASRPDIEAELVDILTKPTVLETAYGTGITQKDLTEMGKELVKCTIRFHATRILSQDHKQQKWKLQEVKDIEDCHWSPEFGLKGKVDCIIQVQIDECGETLIVPLEFKTGNPRFEGKFNVQSEHVGQVRLYMMLMRRSFGVFDKKGILYYIQENNLVECTAATSDLQALIMARNTIVFRDLLSKEHKGIIPYDGFPDPSGVQFDFHCQRCEYRTVCAMSSRLKNTGSCKNKSDVEQKLENSIGHLSVEDLKFFDKWFRVLILEAEEYENNSNVKRIWLNSVAQREKDGNCIGNLHFQSQEMAYLSSMTHLTFRIPESKKHTIENIVENDFVILGTERDPCIRHGVVSTITALTITLSVDRALSERYICTELDFTIDKVASNNPGMIQFAFLSKLMEDTPEATRARQCVVRQLPVFQSLASTDITEQDQQILSRFNKVQTTAIMKSLTTDSFLLVKGCPGCGKTSTIVGLCRLLVAHGKTILISAYTNNAVDNILTSYKHYSKNFVRIGSGGILNKQQLVTNSSNFLRTTVSDVDSLALLYNSTPVVATTLLGLKHVIFKSRRFDYCIIDEGSQALPTSVFGAQLLAKKVVIFGDPNQLPTIIKSNKIKQLNIEDNMFSLLSRPENTCELSIQYRMNQHVMKFPNQLLYRDKMTCATPEQAKHCIKYSGEKASSYLKEKIHLSSTRRWLCYAVSKKPERSVMFLNAQNINAIERVVSTTLQNRKEKDIVIAITSLLIYAGVLPDEIGIIAPFRGQVELIRKSLVSVGFEIEVNTVDQYQGREKNIIIISLTKSVMSGNDFVLEDGILNEARRINVAITRAKYKVIFVGNYGTLKKFPACDDLISHLTDNQKYELTPADFPDDFFQDD